MTKHTSSGYHWSFREKEREKFFKPSESFRWPRKMRDLTLTHLMRLIIPLVKMTVIENGHAANKPWMVSTTDRPCGSKQQQFDKY